ncbi:MAG: hypothetical protein J7L07_00915 [Candidatus Odinarchaeota archaeon]|nr:hypothetical protein [Candidatus Odinarchaeota archaeon]
MKQRIHAIILYFITKLDDYSQRLIIIVFDDAFQTICDFISFPSIRPAHPSEADRFLSELKKVEDAKKDAPYVGKTKINNKTIDRNTVSTRTRVSLIMIFSPSVRKSCPEYKGRTWSFNYFYFRPPI